MNILIPMAGEGSRFQKAGYTMPKPLIDIGGKPMIQWVIESLNLDGNYIFIVQDKHLKFDLEASLKKIVPNCTIIVQQGKLEGAVCSCLLAKDLIDNCEDLIIANSDQYIEWHSEQFKYYLMMNKTHGLHTHTILTFKAENKDPKWSYVRYESPLTLIAEVREKEPISDLATVGVYHFTSGKLYIEAAEAMIKKNLKVNGEFYNAPVYNEIIGDHFHGAVIAWNVSKMYGLGTPEDLEEFKRAKNIH